MGHTVKLSVVFLAVLLFTGLQAPSGLQAQSQPPPPVEGDGFDIPVTFRGSATVVAELYAASGIAARRPSVLWRLTSGPSVTLLGGLTMGVDLLLSNEGNEFRQGFNQIGLNPTWSWGGAHLGYFSRDYSEFVLSGSRVRGAGLDIETSGVRASLQGGRLQRRTVPVAEGEKSFARNMVAGRVGVGAEGGTYLSLTVLGARDEVSEEDGFLEPDTLLLDTIPADLRPEVDTRPQENLVVGFDGGLELLEGALRLEGEVASSVVTRDRFAREVPGDLPIDGPGDDALANAGDVNASTALDMAWMMDASLRLGRTRLQGGYERVGAGYSSLGLPYLIGDRKGYHMSGNSSLMSGRLSLQGQFRHRTNNLESQRRNTVDRVSVAATAAYRTEGGTVVTVTGTRTNIVNDAAPESERLLDNRALVLGANTALQTSFFGKPSVATLGYNFQEAADRVPGSAVPTVQTHSLNLSYQLTLAGRTQLTPTLGAVLTRLGEDGGQENFNGGIQVSTRLLEEQLRLTGGVAQTVAPGREVFNARVRASYPIGWGSELSVRARHTRNSAFGDRPSFEESFLIFSLSRSF